LPLPLVLSSTLSLPLTSSRDLSPPFTLSVCLFLPLFHSPTFFLSFCLRSPSSPPPSVSPPALKLLVGNIASVPRTVGWAGSASVASLAHRRPQPLAPSARKQGGLCIYPRVFIAAESATMSQISHLASCYLPPLPLYPAHPLVEAIQSPL
jgi:hypothetical protein